MSAAIYRLFVSSTFEEFKEERQALHEKVFVPVEQFCKDRGVVFQAIDLRWGVTSEAALNHRALDICLGEINHCQALTPRPNFLLLIGSRYGWRPLPVRIPFEEMQCLKAAYQGAAVDWELVDTWYAVDENWSDPKYVLAPRTGEYIDDEAWGEVENNLRSMLQAAARSSDLPTSEKAKYFHSITHQEIESGILSFEPPEDQTVIVIKDDMPSQSGAGDEKNEDAPLIDDLKRELRERIPKSIIDYHPGDDAKKEAEAALDQLCATVRERLLNIISEDLSKRLEDDALIYEVKAHRAFAEERSRIFVGRNEYTNLIESYLEDSDQSRAPLLIKGEGGVGKSALIASAIIAARTETKNKCVIGRFIGATPSSSQLERLLDSIADEIRHNFSLGDDDEAAEGRRGPDRFVSALGLATDDTPIHVFIDGVDQADHADESEIWEWVSETLPPFVHVVFSGLPVGAMQLINARCPKAEVITLKEMGQDSAQEMLQQLLNNASRTLSEHQAELVHARVKNCSNPLYVRLIYEEVVRWDSSYSKCELASDLAGMVRQLLGRLERLGHGSKLIQYAVGYLAASRSGLAEHEILTALSKTEPVMSEFKRAHPRSPVSDALPQVIWARLLSDLLPFIIQIDADGVPIYRFFHRIFDEIASEIYLAPKSKEIHSALAEYFSDEERQPLWHDRGHDGQKIANVRRAWELPFQLSSAGDKTGTEETLSSFDFLMAKCATNRTADLFDDFLRATNTFGHLSKTARDWMKFFSRNSHILRRGRAKWPAHKILLQLAVEEDEATTPYDAAEKFLGAGKCNWKWLRSAWSKRDDGIAAVYDGHTGNVNGFIRLSDTLGVSWSEDVTLRMWDLTTGDCRHVLRNLNGAIKGCQKATGGGVFGWSGLECCVWDQETGRRLFTWSPERGRITGATPISKDRSVVITSEGKAAIINLADFTASDEFDFRKSLSDAPDQLLERMTWVTGLQDGCFAVVQPGYVSIWSTANNPMQAHPLEHLKCKGDVTGLYLLAGALVVALDNRSVIHWSFSKAKATEFCSDKTREGFPPEWRGFRLANNTTLFTLHYEPLIMGEDKTHLFFLITFDADNDEASSNGLLSIAKMGVGETLQYSEWDGPELGEEALGVVQHLRRTSKGYLKGISKGNNKSKILSDSVKPLIPVTQRSKPELDEDIMIKGNLIVRLAAAKTDNEDKEISFRHARDLSAVGHALLLPGSMFATCAPEHSSDGQIYIWDSRDGALLQTLEGHVAKIPGRGKDEEQPSKLNKCNGLINLDGLIVSWGFDDTVKLWDPSNDAPISSVTFENTLEVFDALLFAPKTVGERPVIAALNSRGFLTLWDILSGKSVALPTDTPQNDYARRDESYFLKKVGDDTLAWSFRDYEPRLWSLPNVFTTGNTSPSLVLKSGESDEIRIGRQKNLLSPMARYRRESQICDIVPLPDGHYGAVSVNEGIRVFDASGQEKTSFSGAALKIVDEETVLTWGRDRTLRLWAWRSGKQLTEFPALNSNIVGVGLIGEGKALSWSEDRHFRLWNTSDGKLIDERTQIDATFDKPGWLGVRTYEETKGNSRSLGWTAWVSDRIVGISRDADSVPICWQGPRRQQITDIVEDGTILCRGSTKSVTVLHLYDGGKRIDLSGNTLKWDTEDGFFSHVAHSSEVDTQAILALAQRSLARIPLLTNLDRNDLVIAALEEAMNILIANFNGTLAAKLIDVLQMHVIASWQEGNIADANQAAMIIFKMVYGEASEEEPICSATFRRHYLVQSLLLPCIKDGEKAITSEIYEMWGGASKFASHVVRALDEYFEEFAGKLSSSQREDVLRVKVLVLRYAEKIEGESKTPHLLARALGDLAASLYASGQSDAIPELTAEAHAILDKHQIENVDDSSIASDFLRAQLFLIEGQRLMENDVQKAAEILANGEAICQRIVASNSVEFDLPAKRALLSLARARTTACKDDPKKALPSASLLREVLVSLAVGEFSTTNIAELAQAHCIYARLLIETGQREEADAPYREALSLWQSLNDIEKNEGHEEYVFRTHFLEFCLEYISYLWAAGKVEAAKKETEAVLKTLPSHPAAVSGHHPLICAALLYNLQADNLFKAGDEDGAMESWKKAHSPPMQGILNQKNIQLINPFLEIAQLPVQRLHKAGKPFLAAIVSLNQAIALRTIIQEMGRAELIERLTQCGFQTSNLFIEADKPDHSIAFLWDAISKLDAISKTAKGVDVSSAVSNFAVNMVKPAQLTGDFGAAQKALKHAMQHYVNLQMHVYAMDKKRSEHTGRSSSKFEANPYIWVPYLHLLSSAIRVSEEAADADFLKWGLDSLNNMLGPSGDLADMAKDAQFKDACNALTTSWRELPENLQNQWKDHDVVINQLNSV